MKIVSAALVTVLSVVLATAAAPAAALDDDDGVAPTEGGLLGSWDESVPGERTPGGRSSQTDAALDPIVDSVELAGCAQGGAQTCNEPELCDDGTPKVYITYIRQSGAIVDGGSNCPEDGDGEAPGQPPQLTPGVVLRAFKRIPLPEAKLEVQPPGGRTLVNFETNFFTEQGEFSRTVTLLGRQVELRIWPASFRWRFGDGEMLDSESPGSAYPDLDITHEYRDRGRVAPRVDATYAAEFRVDGGAWQPVAGTVTIVGTPQELRVVTARPVLVGG